MTAEADLARAIESSTGRPVTTGPRGADVVVPLPGGGRLLVEVKALSRVEPGRVAHALAAWDRELDARRSGAAPVVGVVVADEIPTSAKSVLRDHGWGWLDRRGHLFLDGPGLLVNDTTLGPLADRAPRQRAPLAGRAGVAVGALVLMTPDEPLGVRELARRAGISPAAASTARQALRDASLLGQDGRPLVPELFWALSDEWAPEPVALAARPDPRRPGSLAFGADLDAPGWALGGTLAAAAWGAPVTVRAGFPPDLYVPDAGELRAARRALGDAGVAERRAATVAVAPATVVVARRYPPRNAGGRWPLVHPLFAALDLSLDRSRGIEILDGWTPPAGFTRVW